MSSARPGASRGFQRWPERPQDRRVWGFGIELGRASRRMGCRVLDGQTCRIRLADSRFVGWLPSRVWCLPGRTSLPSVRRLLIARPQPCLEHFVVPVAPRFVVCRPPSDLVAALCTGVLRRVNRIFCFSSSRPSFSSIPGPRGSCGCPAHPWIRLQTQYGLQKPQYASIAPRNHLWTSDD